MDIATKRKMIEKHHGGTVNRSDAHINIIWGSLNEDTKQRYIESMKQNEPKAKEMKRADRNPTE